MRGLNIYLIIFILAILFSLLIFFEKGKTTGFNIKEIERNEIFIVSKVIFKGENNKDIYALFFEPLKENFDIVIVLPGAGGTKESRRHYAEILSGMGYGAFILDQRGIGETGGDAASFEQDFNAFLNKQEVFQFSMAKDVVKACDFLDVMENVNEIAVLGESMGGRNAIIAAGLDRRIKSAIVISSAGYFGSFADARANDFLAYINPNSYISKISPRRILMLHSLNDNVILIANARATFSLAGEPKKFVEFSEKECIHGYCEPMYNYIQEELGKAFGQ